MSIRRLTHFMCAEGTGPTFSLGAGVDGRVEKCPVPSRTDTVSGLAAGISWGWRRGATFVAVKGSSLSSDDEDQDEQHSAANASDYKLMDTAHARIIRARARGELRRDPSPGSALRPNMCYLHFEVLPPHGTPRCPRGPVECARLRGEVRRALL